VFNPREFWEGVWGRVPGQDGADAVRAFHNETCRLVAAMQPGPVKEKAQQALTAPCPEAMSATDNIDAYLGEPIEGVRKRRVANPRAAAGFAVEARRAIYAAELSAPDYDDLPDDRVRTFFRRCTIRATHDFIDELERHVGDDLGRP